MLSFVTALLGVAGQTVKSWVEGRQVERQAKLEIKKIEAQGRVEVAKSLAQTEAQYDNIAQTNMRFTWKDEYILVVYTIPFIVSFVTPYVQLFVYEDLLTPLEVAWTLVAQAPEWYQWAMLGMITATYGLRWAAGGFKLPLSRKKDGKSD